ncbi:hypothetical protein QFZ27_001909 [Inquilinus ginsengisoli]|uniref:eCIS core domain-containing protein n=1 Tax=Inquilinus ginsengisoli TaxID=363840 RepID=UPI003D2206DE
MSTLVLRNPAAPAITPAPSPLLQRKCACGASAGVMGKCAGCDSDERVGVQTKLKVSQPGDPYELEADQIAEGVVSGAGAASALPAITPLVQREEAQPEDDDRLATLQRQAAEDLDQDVQAKVAVGAAPAGGALSRSDLGGAGGAPLPGEARNFFEPRFGRDLGHVRIHDGGTAASLARDVRARAFTYGADIYFGQGQYDPVSTEGRRLLAHELTHTVQQGAGRGLVQRKATPEPGSAPATVRVPMDSAQNPNEAAAEAVVADLGAEHAGAGEAPPPAVGGAAPSDGSAKLPASLGRAILAASGGAPLPAHVRQQHEPRLGTRLDHVRVHQGGDAAAAAEALDARAFTFGSDIWLGAGESLADGALLAHELTHVAQQAPRGLEGGEERVQAVRRHYYSLPPLGKGIRGPGDRSHDYVQEILGKHPPNAGLFSETPIPGGAATGNDGRADFVKTDTGVYFGVTFSGKQPQFLPVLAKKSMKSGVVMTATEHKATATPIGDAGSNACGAKLPGPSAANGICRMGAGPNTISIADLKPNYEAETLLGTGQVGRYITAMDALKAKVDTFATGPSAPINPAGAEWKPKTERMKTVGIPGKFEIPTTASPKLEVKLFVDGVQTRVSEMAVLKIAMPSDGIITYDFIPVHMLGAGTATTGAAATTSTIVDAKTKLTPVKEKLKEEPKRVATLRRPRRAEPRPRLALKRDKLEAKDPYNFNTWKTESFKPWHAAAVTATGGEDKKALTEPSTEAEKRMKDEAVRQINERQKTGFKTAPTGTLERTRELEVVQHWVNHGEKYGRLRQVFGSTYVKVVKTYDSVKERIEQKVAAAKARMGKKAGGSGGIKGAVLAALRGIAGTLLGLFIRDVGHRLYIAVQKGGAVLLNKYFGEEIEELEAQIKQIEEAEAAFKKMIQEALEEKFGEQIKVLEDKIKQVEELAETVKDIGTIVNVVKWAYRIAQCGAPPLLGCILGLVGSALAEAIIAAIVASCWFQREIAYPIVSAMGPIRALPGVVADIIATRVRGLLPDSIKPLMGEVDKTDMASKPSDVDCDAASKYNLDPGQRAMAEMLQNYDTEHVEALMAALKHLGVDSDSPDPGATVTEADVARIKALLDKYSKEKLEEIVKTTPARPPRSGTTKEFTDDLDAAGAPAPQAGGQAAPAGQGPSAEELKREGAQVARLLKASSLPPNSEAFAPRDHQPGETFHVFYARNLKILTGGYQKVTVVSRNGDKSMVVTIHAGTRFYDVDGTLVETTTATFNDTYKIMGEGPGPAPAKAPSGSKTP